jgi:hypothetical protein
MKTLKLNETQIELLYNLVDSSIESLEEYQSDVGKLSKSEKKELNDLYELLYDLSYSNLEDALQN